MAGLFFCRVPFFCNIMSILFISGLQPDGMQSSSGGNAVRGIAEALCKNAGESVEFVSHPNVPSFPNGKLWIRGCNNEFNGGFKVYVLPTLNLKIIKSRVWGVCCKRVIKDWAKRHEGERLKVLVYNTYHPPIDDVYNACRSVGAELYAVLYDLGVPPKRLGLSWLTMIGYRLAEKTAKKYIPLLDGRIIINELIEKHYAPGRSYILVDGGVNQQVINHLFPLKEKQGDVFTFVLAGMLWDQNGTKLVLDAMSRYSYPNVRVIFAGKGNDVPLIEEAAKQDSRISYVGMLNMDELFKLYESADVLLNLRMEEEVDFHFPGKLLEYLATGRYVISTPVAHAERDYGAYMAVLHDRTPEGLSRMMEEVLLMGKDLLYETGMKARTFMLANRTWDVQTQRMLKYMEKNMRVAFYTVMFSLHQIPLADEMYAILGEDFRFFEMCNCADEEKASYVGGLARPYVVRVWEGEESRKEAMEWALTADVALFSTSCDVYPFLKARLGRGLLSFETGERWLKRGLVNIFSPNLIKNIWHYHTLFRNKPFYKLCSSAYCANDQYLLRSFVGRCFKWGYFTRVDPDFGVEVTVPGASTSETIPLMWCARFLKWKHPEIPVMLAAMLKREGFSFRIDMYGSGEELDNTRTLINRLKVEDVVSLKGNLPNEAIIREMRRHKIFLLTSDRREGWGAVMNEAMSNGCAVVSSDAIGSTPFLLKDGENGMVFRSGDLGTLHEKVVYLLEHSSECSRMGREAYRTMRDVWSPGQAARNFIRLSTDLLEGRDTSITVGPCSKALPIKRKKHGEG